MTRFSKQWGENCHASRNFRSPFFPLFSTLISNRIFFLFFSRIDLFERSEKRFLFLSFLFSSLLDGKASHKFPKHRKVSPLFQNSSKLKLRDTRSWGWPLGTSSIISILHSRGISISSCHHNDVIVSSNFSRLHSRNAEQTLPVKIYLKWKRENGKNSNENY